MKLLMSAPLDFLTGTHSSLVTKCHANKRQQCELQVSYPSCDALLVVEYGESDVAKNT
jgi:hypothetical protein